MPVEGLVEYIILKKSFQKLCVASSPDEMTEAFDNITFKYCVCIKYKVCMRYISLEVAIHQGVFNSSTKNILAHCRP